MSEKQNNQVFSSVQFEEDYIFRNYRSITHTPDIALTEFVANAWDAGAYHVDITIPSEDDAEKILIIEDDGVGMTDEQFDQRWLTLNYDRQKKQSNMVEFPKDVEGYKRFAYGHNGVGRHGMFCFNPHYKIETWCEGICNSYDIAISSGEQPFKVTQHSSCQKDGHGTRLSVRVTQHLPDSTKMINIISARYLYDPKFQVTINGTVVRLEDYSNVQEVREAVINNIKLKITVIDTTKASRNTQQNGIAFWVCGRLVGRPAWSINNEQFLDGRCRAAKRYTIIVQTDDLLDEVLPDWTGFHNSEQMKYFLKGFRPQVNDIVNGIMKEQIDDVQQAVIEETRERLETLTPYEQRGVSTFIENVTQATPMINSDFLTTAVESVVTMMKSESGVKLLEQLSMLSDDDMNKLSELLESWSINDILTVMNEIDHRLTVIEAISRTCNDKSTNELHTLHPLILSARWIFGAEFESPLFTSNKTLNTVIENLFANRGYDVNKITDTRKRPDIVMLDDEVFNAVCTERIDLDAGGEIVKPDQILIVELKRGGFKIGYNEVNQALNYMRQIKKSGMLHKTATIHAFVVGAFIDDIDTHTSNESGVLDVLTYSQLVDTARAKLFRLKDKLKDHYDSIDNKSIVERALESGKQLPLN